MKASMLKKLEQLFEIDTILFFAQDIPKLTGIDKVAKKALEEPKSPGKKKGKKGSKGTESEAFMTTLNEESTILDPNAQTINSETM